MKKLFLILIVITLSIGCTQKLSPKECNYCKGGVFWHLTERGVMQNRYEMSAKKEDGKYYHPWCAKIKGAK